MGLFDNLFGSAEASKPFGPHEGFAGILLGASACDGHIADEEVHSLFTMLGRMKMYQRYTEKNWSTLINRLLGLLKRKGVDELMTKSVEALPPELRATAFANACDIVLADGVVEDDEKEFLDKLQSQLDIPDDEAVTIVRVMVLKNKG
ncbi:MAG: tellurite resistance TerB family protein [Gemmataceae bacterium]|nr:tellurite resistance TerB family protein [Gemmataceae bacterium]